MANPTQIKKHHPSKEKIARHRAEPKRSDYPGDHPFEVDHQKWRERDRLPASERSK